MKVSEIRPQNTYKICIHKTLLIEFLLHNDLKIILLIVHIKL